MPKPSKSASPAAKKSKTDSAAKDKKGAETSKVAEKGKDIAKNEKGKSKGGKDKTKSKGGSKDKSKKGSKKGKKGRKKKKKKEPRCPIKRTKKPLKNVCTNPEDPTAVLNSYYVCHGVMEMLKFRKFIWKKKQKPIPPLEPEPKIIEKPWGF